MQGLWGSSRVFFERAFKDLSNDIWLARLFDKPESLIFSIVNNLLKHTTQGVRRWLLADYYFPTCKQRFLIEFVRLFYRPKYLQWAPALYRKYSVWPSTWKHVRAFPMIFYAWDYRSGPIFRCRSQWNIKTPSGSVFEAAVHKQRNAVQHLLPSTRTEPDVLASELFPWLWGVSKWLVESLSMILTILLAFGTSLQQLMLPIRNLRKFSLFHRHAGPRH